ncbi:MAG: GAF domain-containing sensor histidine kinase [Nostocaceae cyanobacterium]|nr:GAF domain-containing sensor histidine kinase [Nostocaceae cyanobacterium]
MLISPDLSFSCTLSVSVFDRLGELLHQMAQNVRNEAVVLTEDLLLKIPLPDDWQQQRFTVVVSDGFNGLLVGSPNNSFPALRNHSPNHNPEYIPQESTLNARLTFNSEAIASFLLQLRDLFHPNSHTHQNIHNYLQIVAPNDANFQSQFTLLLLEYMLPQTEDNFTASLQSNYPHVSVCQPVENALKMQIAQEQLLNRVTTQIRQSTDLQVILSTVITQVREFLALDRLIIYKFEDSQANSEILNTENSNNGKSSQQNLLSSQSSLSLQAWQEYGSSIIYEVRATDAIPSVLSSQEENCFIKQKQCWHKYHQGFTLTVDDVEKTFILEECLLNFYREIQVKSIIAAPIIFENKLWGLLIAHQCNHPKQWSKNEKNLLTAVAEQLAIAIHQAELMQSLTQEKQNLEERVTERTIELHDALVAAEAASRIKSEFLATISHELLTPLTYVIGMSSTLLRWHFGELNQRQKDYLQTIHDSGEHLLEMINDILDLSQIEAGKAVLNLTEFSLIQIAENTVESLLDKAITAQVNLRVDLQVDRQEDRFIADTRRVQQILWNLLTNAIKFTPAGGDVILRIWVENNTAVLQVEDTGIGIPEAQLPLLFEKFHQLNPPYRRHYDGTGLGLALTKQLVELHRGRIEVESTVGTGSIFTVWIPAQEKKLKIKN